MGLADELRLMAYDLTQRVLGARAVQSPSIDVLRRFVGYESFIAPYDYRALLHIAERAYEIDEIDFVSRVTGSGPRWISNIRKLATALGVTPRLNDVPPRALGYSQYLSWLALSGTLGDLASVVIVNFPTFCANTSRLADWGQSNGIEGVEFLRCRGLDRDEERLAEEIALRYYDRDRYWFVVRAVQQYELDFWESLA
ncbi:MAG: TenA family transcriptional regulator [Acidilobus sp.]